MNEAQSESVVAPFRSAFPEEAFTQVDVLTYGDDPDVEPGETAIRAFVDRGGRPAGTFQDDEDVIRAFEDTHREAITWLHRDGRLASIAWIQLIPDTVERRAPGAVLWGFPSMFFGMRSDPSAAAPGFATVSTRLGPEDLATVDALITAGVAASRAEALRWAIGRIRENLRRGPDCPPSPTCARTSCRPAS